MIFFTGDLHLSHSNIIKYCNRPFSNVDEMNETLIDNYKKVVGPKDKVFILGDFAMGDPKKHLRQLPGEKFLIRGNHDKLSTTSYLLIKHLISKPYRLV